MMSELHEKGGKGVAEKVKGIIARQLEIGTEKVTDKARITDDLGADSLDVIEFVSMLEDGFGVEIPDDEAEKMITVGDVIKYVERKTGDA